MYTMSGIAAWTVSILFMVGILIILIELLLRRWVVEDRNRLADGVVSANRHSEAGKGSWTLSPEAAKLLDPHFSLTHWSEMQKWAQGVDKSRYEPISQVDRRNVLTFRGCNFFGGEFSINEGSRSTSDQPDSADQVVACFGGSTTFCIEVADSHTWPSYLQRELNNQTKSRFSVINNGFPGAPGLDRIAQFQFRTALRSGDIAVFLFGDNDSGWKQWYPSRPMNFFLVRPLGFLERETKIGYFCGLGSSVSLQ